MGIMSHEPLGVVVEPVSEIGAADMGDFGSLRMVAPLSNSLRSNPASLTSCLPFLYSVMSPMPVRIAAAVGVPIRGNLRSTW